jgi:hypothetical protein
MTPPGDLRCLGHELQPDHARALARLDRGTERTRAAAHVDDGPRGLGDERQQLGADVLEVARRGVLRVVHPGRAHRPPSVLRATTRYW